MKKRQTPLPVYRVCECGTVFAARYPYKQHKPFCPGVRKGEAV